MPGSPRVEKMSRETGSQEAARAVGRDAGATAQKPGGVTGPPLPSHVG